MPKEHNSKADAIYGRYSSHAQDDGTSIEVQAESCRRAAGGPCIEYVDRARTGRTIGGRAEFQRLMDDAEAGRIGRLFVYKYDRLGRAAETHVLVAQLEELGYRGSAPRDFSGFRDMAWRQLGICDLGITAWFVSGGFCFL